MSAVDESMLVALSDFAVGGYVSTATQYALQVRGWVRMDRYGSPVLTTTGENIIKQLRSKP